MYECRVCWHWTFRTEGGLHSHCSAKENHFYCIECRRLFLREDFLEQDLSSKVHGGGEEDVLWCSLCPKDCRTRDKLRLHWKRDHYYCKVYDRVFGDSYALRQIGRATSNIYASI
ncbi:hypothetical protein ARMSODRAFT_1071062 [Armillaria solidipes]|uniref:C2H2-type domain-containing protein n=1 Tax=Armillaria solidipes TaxID=1076256 RepID=A0A2H3ASX2_9AGAR|nr:hypothetical protein ARMSODRAFT_1071062 [Armillaria solidipes]